MDASRPRSSTATAQQAGPDPHSEALPHLQDYSLSLGFATRADADSFAELYGRILGIATVTVFCVD